MGHLLHALGPRLMAEKKETLEERTARLRQLRLARDAEKPAEVKRTRRYARRWPVFQLDDEIPFGKHKGSDLRDVIEADPDWVIWALDNIGDFAISAEAEIELLPDPRRPPRAWE